MRITMIIFFLIIDAFVLHTAFDIICQKQFDSNYGMSAVCQHTNKP